MYPAIQWPGIRKFGPRVKKFGHHRIKWCSCEYVYVWKLSWGAEPYHSTSIPANRGGPAPPQDGTNAWTYKPEAGQSNAPRLTFSSPRDNGTKFWVFVVKYEDQELIWLKFHKFPRFNNSKGNRIVGGKLVRPAIHCRVCFWLAARVRLPTPVLKAFACWKTRSKSYWYNYNVTFFMIFSWLLWCNTFMIFLWLLWCNTFHVYYFTVISFVFLHDHSPTVE